MTEGHKAKWFIADYCFTSVTEIDPEWVLSLGIRGLLLDIDNTLCRWEVREIPAAEQAWLDSLQEAGLKLRLLSNGLPSKVSRVVEQAGIKHVDGRPMKPLPFGFRRGVKELELEPLAVMMIGDSVIPDIYGANRAGLYTCLVDPLGNIDFLGSKFWRLLEVLFRLRHPVSKDHDFRQQD